MASSCPPWTALDHPDGGHRLPSPTCTPRAVRRLHLPRTSQPLCNADTMFLLPLPPSVCLVVMGILYKLTFASGKHYIGVTLCSLKKRMWEHTCNAKTSRLAVHCAWRKYGPPSITVLAIVERYMLRDAERRAVAAFRSFAPFGYNLTPGGDANPALEPETKAKISKAKMGHPVSAETRAKLSAANRGFVHSAETRAKMSKTRLGRKKSEAHRAALSKAHLGKKKSQEHCASMSRVRIGRKVPEKYLYKWRARKLAPEQISALQEARRLARLRKAKP